MHRKRKFNGTPNFNGKIQTLPINCRPQLDHIRPNLLETNLANPRLTSQKNYFGSNKGNHRNPLTRVDGRSDFNESLVFLQLVTHKCLGRVAARISANKKIAKTITKGEKQKSKNQLFAYRNERVEIKGRGLGRG